MDTVKKVVIITILVLGVAYVGARMGPGGVEDVASSLWGVVVAVWDAIVGVIQNDQPSG